MFKIAYLHKHVLRFTFLSLANKNYVELEFNRVFGIKISIFLKSKGFTHGFLSKIIHSAK